MTYKASELKMTFRGLNPELIERLKDFVLAAKAFHEAMQIPDEQERIKLLIGALTLTNEATEKMRNVADHMRDYIVPNDD